MGGGKPEGSTHYCGIDTHKYINGLINSAGDILIVSPYIDDYYARMLSDSGSDRRFYIIASSIEQEVSRRLSGRKSPFAVLGYMLLSMLLVSVSTLAGLGLMLIIPSLIPAAIGLFKYSSRKQNIVLKVPRQFVHAKIYISDNMAITGSANLTYKGTHRNLEQISITYNSDEISRLRGQFWDMWHKL
ncbi:MAG: phospholipase D family protein [Candidatus Marsarchaeota archaeon]|nr:phospholipase D family protein [Candidatus Marsarchaeota archaeon]MCL5413273.1 phospholipase D family protein [Candidatus Marsarchaeota archaeon]